MKTCTLIQKHAHLYKKKKKRRFMNWNYIQTGKEGRLQFSDIDTLHLPFPFVLLQSEENILVVLAFNFSSKLYFFKIMNIILAN